MSAPPQPKVTQHGPRRRRSSSEPKGLKSVPLVVWILLAVCLLVVLSIPIASYHGWRWKRSVSGNVLNEGAFGVVVSEASVDTKCNCIRGSVANGSNQAYNEVHVIFQL